MLIYRLHGNCNFNNKGWSHLTVKSFCYHFSTLSFFKKRDPLHNLDVLTIVQNNRSGKQKKKKKTICSKKNRARQSDISVSRLYILFCLYGFHDMYEKKNVWNSWFAYKIQISDDERINLSLSCSILSRILERASVEILLQPIRHELNWILLYFGLKLITKMFPTYYVIVRATIRRTGWG